MTDANYALHEGALAYLDADDGRVKGQEAPTDDTPEDEILCDIGGSKYLIGEWSDESVVELVVPSIDDAAEYPEIARHMSDAANRYHSDRSDISAWLELIEQLDKISPIVRVLKSHGDRFTFTHVGTNAQEWLDYYFDSDQVDEWCKAGVWCPTVANELNEAFIGPDDLKKADSNMVDHVCYGITCIDDLIEAIKN